MAYEANPSLDSHEEAIGLEFQVVGPPGCGKTTWLEEEVEQSVDRGESVLVGSFTRAAADEVAGRHPLVPAEQVGTLHSFCYRVLDKPEIALDKKTLKDWNALYPHYAVTPVNRDFTEPTHGHAHEGTSLLRGDRLLSDYDWYRATVTTEQMPPALRHFGHRWTRWKQDCGLLDFTDLIEECLRHVPVGPGNPRVIFIDEAQDLSPIELLLVRKWGRQAGRLVLVGDPDQTIYTWRGANHATLSHPPVPDEQRLILTQSYRVPVEVHALAVRWINRIPDRQRVEYWPRPERGDVSSSRATWKDPQRAISEAERYLDENKKVMFLSSCAYMLRPLLKHLRRRGIPFHNPYRRSNHEWNPVLRRRPPSMADRVRAYLRLSHRGMWSPDDITMWTSAFNAEDVLRPGAAELIERLIGDKVPNVNRETIAHLLTHDAMEAACRGDLVWFGRHMRTFARRSAEYPLAVAARQGPGGLFEPPRLTVGTVHSVKGAEADVVFLFPDLSGSGMKMWLGNATARASIYRLFYVGMTRARETLVLLSPGGRATVKF